MSENNHSSYFPSNQDKFWKSFIKFTAVTATIIAIILILMALFLL